LIWLIGETVDYEGPELQNHGWTEDDLADGINEGDDFVPEHSGGEVIHTGEDPFGAKL
jgi:hypothetical protein